MAHAGGTFALFSQLRRAGDMATPDTDALPSDKELSTYTVGPRSSMSTRGSNGLTSPLFGRKSSGPKGTIAGAALSPPPADASTSTGVSTASPGVMDSQQDVGELFTPLGLSMLKTLLSPS